MKWFHMKCAVRNCKYLYLHIIQSNPMQTISSDIPSIYDNYQFQDRHDNTVAGYSCMTKPKYNTLVIPLGLVVNNHTDESPDSDADIDIDTESYYSVVQPNTFDSLFYSVGKNLGKPHMSSRKTRKLHRK